MVETAELQKETLSRLREEKEALERQAMDIAVGLRDLEKAQEVLPRGERETSREKIAKTHGL